METYRRPEVLLKSGGSQVLLSLLCGTVQRIILGTSHFDSHSYIYSVIGSCPGQPQTICV